jgi:transcriptional regulator with XRE-family HTH domain
MPTTIDDTKAKLGRRIQAFRKQRKLTQEQFGELIGVDARHISRIETGTHAPSFETLEHMAAALKLPIADLLTFQKDEDSEEAMRFYLIDLARTLELQDLRRVVRLVRAALEKS